MTETDPGWIAEARRIAYGIRRRSLEVAVEHNGAYLGQACSGAEILAALLVGCLRPDEGDVLVLSPAHYCLALWAGVVERGELPAEALESYGVDGAQLEMIGGGGTPGMLFTTGSLAQGMSQGIGYALGRRIRGERGRVVVFASDGELQEGQTWEALMALAHYDLREVVVVFDLNDSQVDGSPREIMAVEPVVDKLRAFGLDAVEVDGHDLAAVQGAVEGGGSRPRALACRTRIWEGISTLAERHNLHFVRFRPGEETAAREALERHAEAVG